MSNFKEITIKHGDIEGFNGWVKMNRDSYKGGYGDTYSEICLETASKWINLSGDYLVENPKDTPLNALLKTAKKAFKDFNGTGFQASMVRDGVASFSGYEDLISLEDWNNTVLSSSKWSFE